MNFTDTEMHEADTVTSGGATEMTVIFPEASSIGGSEIAATTVTERKAWAQLPYIWSHMQYQKMLTLRHRKELQVLNYTLSRSALKG
jgi:hypothetical protein